MVKGIGWDTKKLHLERIADKNTYLALSFSVPSGSNFLRKNIFQCSYSGKYIKACEMPTIEAVSPENKVRTPSYY